MLLFQLAVRALDAIAISVAAIAETFKQSAVQTRRDDRHDAVHQKVLPEGVSVAVRSEDRGRPYHKLSAPSRNLVQVTVELLHQLGQHLLARYSCRSQLRLESRTVVPACSLRLLISCSASILAAFGQKLHIAGCADQPSHRYPAMRIAMDDDMISLSMSPD